MVTEAWVVVLKTRDQRQSTEAGLVLTALQIEYEVTSMEGNWMVSVPAKFAPQAGIELAEYAQENRTPPVGARPMAERGNGWSGVLIYAGVLVLVAVMARRYEFGYDWLGLGRIDSTRVLEGEWWRTLSTVRKEQSGCAEAPDDVLSSEEASDESSAGSDAWRLALSIGPERTGPA